MTRLLGILIVTSLLVVGCGGSEPNESTADKSTSRPKPTAYEDVSFQAADGESRAGRLFGRGKVAVVLTHMGRPEDSQADWADFAKQLADRGYLALTYERREAYEEMWMDVLGAADYLRQQGAETVVAAGASIGAMASLRAAEEPENKLDGVIWLAGALVFSGYEFQRADVARVACPLLIAAGDQDAYAPAPDVRLLHRWVQAPKNLLIVESVYHGTDILAQGDASARTLTRAMLRFVDNVAQRSANAC